MSERLKEVKTANEVLNHNNPAWKEKINWLIQQAERVDELEKENESYLFDIDHAKYHKVISDNQRYKQALEFYANENNYDLKLDKSKSEPFSPHYYKRVDMDNGDKARQALKGESE